jgi:hypothetical protein
VACGCVVPGFHWVLLGPTPQDLPTIGKEQPSISQIQVRLHLSDLLQCSSP